MTNIVSMLRNLWTFKFKYNLAVKLVVITVQVALSLKINNMGIIGWLPVLSACTFTWFLDVKSDIGLKILICTTQIPWLIYDLYIFNYTGTVFDILSLISNSIGIMILRKNAILKAKENAETNLQ